MKLVKGTLMGVGVVALIASLMNIVAPKAVHAAVAALVEVANTPTTAVPTVAAPAASQLYFSSCTASYGGSGNATCNFAPVPAGQTLFIESASIHSSSSPGADPASAWIAADGITFVPMVQQAAFPGSDNFAGSLAGRIWAKAGTPLFCYVALNNNSGGGLQCAISGYLAPAQ
jgi:hypothetical protein